jgi:hypothetical protein
MGKLPMHSSAAYNWAATSMDYILTVEDVCVIVEPKEVREKISEDDRSIVMKETE